MEGIPLLGFFLWMTRFLKSKIVGEFYLYFFQNDYQVFRTPGPRVCLSVGLRFQFLLKIVIFELKIDSRFIGLLKKSAAPLALSHHAPLISPPVIRRAVSRHARLESPLTVSRTTG